MEQDEKFRREYVEKYGAEQTELMLDLYKDSLKNYHRASLIDQGIVGSGYYEAYTKRNADYLGLEYRRVAGDRKLLRDFIGGNWDDKRFLIVEPGKTIGLSVGDRIVKAV